MMVLIFATAIILINLTMEDDSGSVNPDKDQSDSRYEIIMYLCCRI